MKVSNLYRQISSIKTGLILLGIIGLLSALASVKASGLFFQSTVFKVILVLLFINMFFCTVNRLAGYSQKILRQNVFWRERVRGAGILLLHAGVVFILLGGIVNSFGGQSAAVSIAEGEALDVSGVLKQAEPIFIRLDKFQIFFNEDGSPSQYSSDITLYQEDSLQENSRISVNNPLKYRGIKAYQQGFGYLVDIQGESASGIINRKTLKEKDVLTIEEAGKTVFIHKYIPNYDPRYGMESKTLRPDNPRIIYSVYDQGSFLWAGAANIGEKVQLDDDTFVCFNGIKPYTVLDLKKDPGLAWAAAGGLMLMAGTSLALFIKRREQEDLQ